MGADSVSEYGPICALNKERKYRTEMMKTAKQNRERNKRVGRDNGMRGRQESEFVHKSKKRDAGLSGRDARKKVLLA